MLVKVALLQQLGLSLHKIRIWFYFHLAAFSVYLDSKKLYKMECHNFIIFEIGTPYYTICILNSKSLIMTPSQSLLNSTMFKTIASIIVVGCSHQN